MVPPSPPNHPETYQPGHTPPNRISHNLRPPHPTSHNLTHPYAETPGARARGASSFGFLGLVLGCVVSRLVFSLWVPRTGVCRSPAVSPVLGGCTVVGPVTGGWRWPRSGGACGLLPCDGGVPGGQAGELSGVGLAAWCGLVGASGRAMLRVVVVSVLLWCAHVM